MSVRGLAKLVADPGSLKVHVGVAGGVADQTERYRNIRRQNRLRDSFVPFLNF